MPDGQNLLGSIHGGGFFKKVQTKQVILTPNAKSSVRLDELNKILDQMAGGAAAWEWPVARLLLDTAVESACRRGKLTVNCACVGTSKPALDMSRPKSEKTSSSSSL